MYCLKQRFSTIAQPSSQTGWTDNRALTLFNPGGADLPSPRANAYIRRKSMGGNSDNFCIFLLSVFWEGMLVTLSSNRNLAGVVFDVVCAVHLVPQTICVHSERKIGLHSNLFSCQVRLHV